MQPVLFQMRVYIHMYEMFSLPYQTNEWIQSVLIQKHPRSWCNDYTFKHFPHFLSSISISPKISFSLLGLAEYYNLQLSLIVCPYIYRAEWKENVIGKFMFTNTTLGNWVTLGYFSSLSTFSDCLQWFSNITSW